MKNKLLNTLIIIGAACLAALAALVAADVVEFGTLWFDYAVLGSILLIFVSLNFKFRKYTDFDETISCVRRAKRAILKITPDKDVSYVKLLSVQNQLSNASIYLEDVTAKHDLYQLKSLLKELNGVRNHYKTDDELKIRLSQSVIKGDADVLDSILSSLKKIQE